MGRMRSFFPFFFALAFSVYNIYIGQMPCCMSTLHLHLTDGLIIIPVPQGGRRYIYIYIYISINKFVSSIYAYLYMCVCAFLQPMIPMLILILLLMNVNVRVCAPQLICVGSGALKLPTYFLVRSARMYVRTGCESLQLQVNGRWGSHERTK